MTIILTSNKMRVQRHDHADDDEDDHDDDEDFDFNLDDVSYFSKFNFFIS